MRLYNYIFEVAEDKDPELEYRKAMMDLKVALKTREFMKGERIPLNPPERRFGYLNKKVSLVKKIITTAEKARKLAVDNGISIDDDDQKLLDQVPTKEDVADVKVPFRLERS